MIFRFDDICLNTNMKNAIDIALFLKSLGHDVQFAVSFTCQFADNEFVFKPILKAYSNHRLFFNIDKIGIPDYPKTITTVSHGFIHIDHRLMCEEAQELSIISSCSLIKTNVFAPPLNKWNEATEKICDRNNIHLQKFEDGWRGVEHNSFSLAVDKWYLHSRNLTLAKIKKWIGES